MARGPGLEIGEYEGYPINLHGLMKAASWDASIIANPERQCIPLPIIPSASGFRMWKEVNPLTQEEIAWHLRLDFQAQERTIWMDGRPHPSEYAAHTWQGFSTGKWVRNQLVVSTTHLKVNVIERNGIPRSDFATTVEHFIRRDNVLTVVHIVNDPVWLEAPFLQTRDYTLDVYAGPNASSCVPVNEVANRSNGYVPFYLPGKNPLLLEASKKYNVPVEAIGGGAQTDFPEFQEKWKGRAQADLTMSHRALTKPPAPKPLSPAPTIEIAKTDLAVLPVQGNVYALMGPTGNTTVQVGEYALFVVDPPVVPLAEKALAAIRQISPKPIIYVIDTSLSAEHIGGNDAIAKAGTAIGGSAGTLEASSEKQRSPVLAHENVLKRVSAPTGAKSLVAEALWPSETYVGHDHRLFNGEPVIIIHEPAAHTDGDSLVFFQGSGVITAGNVYSTVTYPVIDSKNGGTIKGTIDALNNLIDLTTPRDHQEAGVYVIPGHGRISDQADLVEYRDMVTIIRDRIADMLKRGLSLAQVQEAQPTFDYDLRYGMPVDGWTKEMFVETIYDELVNSSKNGSR
jgi:glyoxylase-like metal-dependent hydrolase (beta-lactamase superfamily II)